MENNSEMKQKIQIVLAVAIAIAAIRAGYILYQRHEGNKAETTKETAAAPALNPDYYVAPKKLYPYDLKSAKQLTQQPVWVKEGYRYTYYGYDARTKHVDFEHEAGLLLPIEQLTIKDVATAKPPTGGRLQVMAVFQKKGRTMQFPS